MDDREAIERYNEAGSSVSPGARVCWPDLALDAQNLARLVEGLLDARFDFARLAFGEDFDVAAAGERLVEAWRMEAVHGRYAPEGVFVRAAFAIRITIEAGDDELAGTSANDAERDSSDEDSNAELLHVNVELCVSFTALRHTRPFVDFMGGEVRRMSDGMLRRLDPFTHEISPQDAVAWGLNGTDA